MSSARIAGVVSLRPMVVADLDQVLWVEGAAYAFPWSEKHFRDCLNAGYCCWVAECRDQLVGHAVMSTGGGECEILNICVHPGMQGRRIGRRLLRRLLSLGRRHNADTAFLEVRPSNMAAVALYLSEGFCEVGQRRGYYPTDRGREDAVIMAKTLF